ncbi:MAG: hypothetical protein ACT4N2_01530 [Hyphomicrobium sp.]
MISLGWASARGGETSRDRSDARLSAFDRTSAVLAMVALVGSSMAQAPADPADEIATVEAAARYAAAAPERETMVGAYMGAPHTYASDVKVSAPPKHDFTVRQVEWNGEPFKNPIYYGVRIARWFEGGNRGAMLDFTHSKALAALDQNAEFTGTINGAPAPARATIRDIFKKLEASHGHNMLTLNGLLRLPGFGLRIWPYVGIGGGISLPHSEVHIKSEPARTYEYQYAGLVGQALVGVEVRLPRLSYFLEYKFSFAPYEMPLTGLEGYILWTDLWRQFRRWSSGEAPPGGYLTTTYTSHQVIGGLGVRVAPAAAPAP